MSDDVSASPNLSTIETTVARNIGQKVASGWWRGEHASYRMAKRTLDIIVSTVLLLITSPLLLAAAIAIRLDSKGPAVFRQTRIGLDGRPFKLYKFRGMYADARDRFPDLYDYTYRLEDLSSLRFHPANDPRVTRIGRILRRTSIDELPNLVNVLLGEMSLVGPRPEIPEMLPHYGEAQSIILGVKPGVTSPAKAAGRDELTFTQTLSLDVDYALHRSFALDIRVLGQTILTVLRQDGVD